MKIGIDARSLSVGRGGIFKGLQNLLSELLLADQENEYYLYSHHDFDHVFSGHNWQKRIGRRWPSFLPGTFWLQTGGRHLILQDQLDVFWGYNHVLPHGLVRSTRKFVTVHDLTWRLYPETMKRYNQALHYLFAERSIRAADVIIAYSESTARDLENTLGVTRSKIRVIHNGASPQYRPHDAVASANYVASQFRVSRSYICAVGTLEPRKNLVTLIEAVARLRRGGVFNHQLLIAGASGWKDSPIYSSVRRHGLTSKEVTFLGYIPDEDLPLLYSGATAFVFPSLYEGFGLPLVEAMACGAPIVASNASSIPEVVGDAGILVAPLDTEGFAEAILRIVRDTDLRRSLIEKGLRRARCFRWDTAAQEILGLFSGNPRAAGFAVEDASEMPTKQQVR